MSKENKTIGALDKLIEKKAKEQLQKDIIAYFKLITEHPLFDGIKHERVKTGMDSEKKQTYTTAMYEALEWRSGYLARCIETELLEKYKEKKAEELLQNFESLNQSLKEKTS